METPTRATSSDARSRGIRLRGCGVAAVLAVSGCVFVPKTVDLYDSECQTTWKQMELEPVQLGVVGPCSNGNCAAELVGVGAVAAASAVVSGSIVIVGNVVYWMEKQGRCVRKAKAPVQPAEPAPPEGKPVREDASPSNS